jgi:transposase-like protein
VLIYPNRGVQDCLIAAVDGLAGFPDAVNSVFPNMVRNSVEYVSYKDLKAVTAGLKEIYLAPSADAASDSLERLPRNGTENIRLYQSLGGAGGTR